MLIKKIVKSENSLFINRKNGIENVIICLIEFVSNVKEKTSNFKQR